MRIAYEDQHKLTELLANGRWGLGWEVLQTGLVPTMKLKGEDKTIPALQKYQ